MTMNRNTRIQLWALAITFVILMLLTMTTWVLDGWLLVPAGAIGALYLFIVLHPPSPPVVLMVDRSGSMYSDTMNEKAINIAQDFIHWAIERDRPVFVIQFDDRVRSVNFLNREARTLTWLDPNGGTNYPLSLARSLAAVPGSRQVLITDGFPTYGKVDLEGVDLVWLEPRATPYPSMISTARTCTRLNDEDHPAAIAALITKAW